MKRIFGLLLLGFFIFQTSFTHASSGLTTSKSLNSRGTIVDAILATFAAIVIFLLLLNINQRVRNRDRHQARIETLQKYSYRRAKRATNRIRTSITSYSFIPNRAEEIIKKRLELIHSTLDYKSVVQIFIGVWVFLVLLFIFMLHSLLLALIISSLFLPVGFNAITNNIRAKQKQAFAEELPDLLNILASALRSGLSLPQGLEAYSADTKGEVAREIRRTLSEVRVGTPIEEALIGVAERMDSEDLRWAVTALSIQRIVGGSMATILTTTFETVKSRAEIRREVKTLAAEGKLSAYVLISLPLGIFTFLFITRREYVKIFWTDPTGIFLLMVIGVSLSIGWAWMKKIVEIKI
jgi:tight adherence protein B